MIEITANTPDNIVIAAAHGTVTHEDYKKTFVPAIEEKLQHHTKVRLLYHLGQDFSNCTIAAILDDAKLGLKHLTDFEKVAIVTDTRWVSEAASVFGTLFTCPVKTYANDQLPEAKAWIAAA
jgi:hypothetical protein